MISVTILTKNSERYLQQVLLALKPFDEVIIYDTGSKDATFDIAKQFLNVKIYKKSFVGFGPTHNLASALAKNDWILSVDSDEIICPEMAHEILHTPLDPLCVYSFPRHNFFNEKWIKWCGWYPDRCHRLYHRKMTAFSNNQVHEGIIRDKLKSVPLKSPIKHYSYASISEFLQKMQLYSDLFAKQNKGKRSSPTKAVLHGLFAFFKSYILKKGCFGGYEGLIISLYNGHTAYYKYLKLYEANQKGLL